MKNLKIIITDAEGILLARADYLDYMREARQSDESCGVVDHVPPTIEEFAAVMAEEIVREYSLQHTPSTGELL